MKIPNNLISGLFNSNKVNLIPDRLLNIIIKKQNIYFIKSELNEFPEVNYPFNFSLKDLENNLINFKKNPFKFPFNEFPQLALLLKFLFKENKNFSLFDFGAQYIDNYLFLQNINPNIDYYYHDQEKNNLLIKEFINKKNLKNITVIEKIDNINQKTFDFVYFGSVIQYLKNYEEILEKILIMKPKYVFFSGTNFYFNYSEEKLISKQLNVFPQINYCYFFKFSYFKNLLYSRGYSLDYVAENLHGNLINYKHMNKKINDHCKYFDVLFKLNE